RVWCGDGISGTNNTSYDSSYNIPGDYFAAECFINASFISASDGNHVRSTFSHEVGHSLGLGDVENSNGTIMNPSYTDRTVHTPSPNDKTGVVNLYIYRAAD
ncbi:MAG: matrixin family metalloprotease, partial [Clostridia bacterium]|nr:matrixin family metalloprotease [Clostridia bacterium]